LRIRKNFYVTSPATGKQIKVSHLFNCLDVNQCQYLHKIYSLKGQLYYLSASKIKNNKGLAELQVIISFKEPEKALDCYKQRWQIESAFKALKSSGFNIEDTHLNDISRIEKLIAIVLIAFIWCYMTGLYIHSNIKNIRILRHGYKAKSFVKAGLECIANSMLNPYKQLDRIIFFFCHVLRKSTIIFLMTEK